MESSKSSHILIIMTTILFVTSSQKTNYRGCECQYVLDGKCAYTLMVPLGKGGDQSSTCPTKSTQPSDLDTLQSDINSLKSKVADQSETLNQVQRSILHQQEVMRNMSSSSSSNECSDGCQRLITKIENEAASRELRLNGLNATVNAQRQDVETLNQKVQQTSNDVSELKKITDIGTLLNQSKSLETQVTKLQATIESLKRMNKLCNNEGFMVSGTQHNISDSSITASSQYDDFHSPNRSRLHTQANLNSKLSGAWCPKETTEPRTRYEWIQYDLGSEKTILGMATQGRHEYPQWVEWYYIQYASESPSVSSSWKEYRNIGGSVVYFPGNWDQQDVNVNYLHKPIKARYFRIAPTRGGTINNAETNICFRADLIGCLDDL